MKTSLPLLGMLCTLSLGLAFGGQEFSTQPPPRWRFGDPQDEEWKTAHDLQIERIDTWWKTFESRAEDLDALFKGTLDWDLVTWMIQHLDTVDERLMWEFGPGLKSDHRLVITPEHQLNLRPMTATLIERAPSLPGWEFCDRRLPEAADRLEPLLEGRGLRSLEGAKFQWRPAIANQVDIILVHRDFDGPEDEDAWDAAFTAIELLLGETSHIRWVGEIEVASELDASLPSLTAGQLRPAIEQWRSRIDEQLPERALCQAPADTFPFTSYTLKVETAEDYPYQWDLLSSTTCAPEVFAATHSRAFFDSRRFSKHDEFFCYLKVEHLGGDPSELLGALESSLQETLRTEQLGLVTRFGTGKRYTYLEFALVDLERSVPRVRDLAKAAGASERSWILFHDADLDAEWVGVHPTTPPPPR